MWNRGRWNSGGGRCGYHRHGNYRTVVIDFVGRVELRVKQASENLIMSEVEIVYAGFLVKQGKVIKNWKNRWFELGSDQRLKYYRQSPGNKPSVAGTEAGIINLRFCNKVLKGSECGLKKWPTQDLSTAFALVLRHRTYYLYASHPNEANDWQTYINLYAKGSGDDGAEPVDEDPDNLSESEDEQEEKATDTFSCLSANLMADASVNMKRSKSVIRGRLDTVASNEMSKETLEINRMSTAK